MTTSLTTSPHLPTLAAVYLAAADEVGAYDQWEDDMAAITARLGVDPQAMYDALAEARAARFVTVPVTMLAGLLDIVDQMVLDGEGPDNDLACAIARDVVKLNELLPADQRRGRRERYADLLTADAERDLVGEPVVRRVDPRAVVVVSAEIRSAVAGWESGTMTSPSADDLILGACRVLGRQVPADTTAMAERVWIFMQDTVSDDELAEYIIDQLDEAADEEHQR